MDNDGRRYMTIAKMSMEVDDFKVVLVLSTSIVLHVIDYRNM
jgi:hypothetical protein